MEKIHCWRVTIKNHRFVFFVYTESLSATKRVAQQAKIPAPKQSDLVGVSSDDAEFRALRYARDVLYWADEEDFPLAYRTGDRSSIDEWIRTGGRGVGQGNG